MTSTSHASRIESPPLVVRFGAIGDMIMTTPLLRALAERHGRPCDVLGRGPWMPSLFAQVPFVGTVRSIDSLYWPPAWLSWNKQRAIAWLRQRGAGPVYLLQTDADTMRLLKPARLNVTAFNEQFDQRATEHTCDRLLRVGGFGPEATRGSQLAVSADEVAEVNRWLTALGAGSSPVVLIQPGNRRTRRFTQSARDHKVWPNEHWVTVIQGVLERLPQAQVLILGSPKEQPLAAALAKECGSPRVKAVADQLPLRRLFALLTRAHSMISVDTGPAHAAAALGCPIVGIFGRTDPRVTGPQSMSSPVIPVVPPLARQLRSDQEWLPGLEVGQVEATAVVQAWAGLLASAPMLQPA
jgi:heptosyltransferase-2/heptosyltransferase-3